MAGNRESIAQAVVDALNAASTAGTAFNQPVAAVMKFVPAAALADLSALKTPLITVVPIGPEDRSIWTRAASQKDLSIDVAIQQKVSDLTALDDGTTNPASVNNSAQVSGLMQLAEQVAAFLEPLGSPGQPLAGLGATWIGTKCPVLYDLDHLLTQHVFTSLIVVTYRYR